MRAYVCVCVCLYVCECGPDIPVGACSNLSNERKLKKPGVKSSVTDPSNE